MQKELNSGSCKEEILLQEIYYVLERNKNEDFLQAVLSRILILENLIG